MGGPETGKYWIQHSYYHRVRLGIDDGGAPVAPVITNGEYNFFTVTKLDDGTYAITIQGADRLMFTQVDGNAVVADIDSRIKWNIAGPENGPYTIEVNDHLLPPRGWTVRNPEPKQPVTIDIIQMEDGQKFDFIRLNE